MSTQNSDDDAPAPRGRPFPPGNPGRPRGSKNRLTKLAQAMLDDDTPELMRTGLDMAKNRNEKMLKFFLPLTLPKARLIEIELPKIYSASDGPDALLVIQDAVASGEISPGEGAALVSIVQAQVRIIIAAEHELRLSAIEAKLKE